MVEAGRRLRASANSSHASSNATFLWPYLNQSRGSPLATIRSLRVTALPGHSEMGRVASLCVPCHLGRVDELAGPGLGRGGGVGQYLSGLRFVHHLGVPPPPKGLDRNGVNF